MAQIWMDEENMGALMMPRSARKAMNDNEMHASVKKTVLGQLNNVLFSKPAPTPFKGAKPKSPASCAPKISLCKETLKKQHRKQFNKEAPQLLEGKFKAPQLLTHSANDLYAKSADPDSGFDLFDFMDFPSTKCLKNCQKPITQEECFPLFDDDQISKLLNFYVEEEERGFDEPPAYPDTDADDSWAWEPSVSPSNDIRNDAVSLPEPQLPPFIF